MYCKIFRWIICGLKFLFNFTAGMANSTMGSAGGTALGSFESRALSDKDIQLELDKIFQTLQLLKERGGSIDSGTTNHSHRIGKLENNKRT